MMRPMMLNRKTSSNPQSSASVAVKETTRQSIRRLLKNQVPENAPTYKQIGNHVLVGVRVATK